MRKQDKNLFLNYNFDCNSIKNFKELKRKNLIRKYLSYDNDNENKKIQKKLFKGYFSMEKNEVQKENDYLLNKKILNTSKSHKSVCISNFEHLKKYIYIKDIIKVERIKIEIMKIKEKFINRMNNL